MWRMYPMWKWRTPNNAKGVKGREAAGSPLNPESCPTQRRERVGQIHTRSARPNGIASNIHCLLTCLFASLCLRGSFHALRSTTLHHTTPDATQWDKTMLYTMCMLCVSLVSSSLCSVQKSMQTKNTFLSFKYSDERTNTVGSQAYVIS